MRTATSCAEYGLSMTPLRRMSTDAVAFFCISGNMCPVYREPMKLLREYIERRGYHWRTIRRAMIAGEVPLAYTTKGGQWRFRRPRGASRDELIRWLYFGGGNAKRRCSPELRRWLDAVNDRFPVRQKDDGGPRRGEVPELTVKGLTAAWVHDAVRFFGSMENRRPKDSMTADELRELLEAVRPVRDQIAALETVFVSKSPQFRR